MDGYLLPNGDRLMLSRVAQELAGGDGRPGLMLRYFKVDSVQGATVTLTIGDATVPGVNRLMAVEAGDLAAVLVNGSDRLVLGPVAS